MGMTWKSTNLIGWEYFIRVKGLGFESYECYWCVGWLIFILKLYMVVLGDNIMVNVYELTWNINWLGGLAVIWL